MKVCILQPNYSFDATKQDECFKKLLSLLDECPSDADVVVLPEYSDVLADVKGKAPFYDVSNKNREVLLQKAICTAKRCRATVFVNAGYLTDKGLRNTTYIIDEYGEIVGKYFKAHPAPSEVNGEEKGGHGLDVEYSYFPSAPYVYEANGIRFAFLTCYDFYFYENFAQIARQNVDIIIGCSLQRTDTPEIISIINKFLCYNTNAYLIRSSVSLGEDSKVCACSSATSPKGEILLDMKNSVGIGTCEINPKEKFYKPAGYKGKLKAHYEYVEQGRRPWLYRNAGASVVRFEEEMPYPRLCAHRGFNTVAPENSLVALGSAVALGAEEIEFDIWPTKDNVLVSCHDATLERVSDGRGKIYEHTYEELLKLDFGVKHGEKFKGLKIPTFEEILIKFASRVIMNIHVKLWDEKFEDCMLEEIVGLVRKYDCQKHVYFMTSNDEVIKKLSIYAPDIKCCVGWDGNKDPMSIVDRAIALNAYKVQLFKPYFNQETIQKAHKHGILCNVFWSDDPKEAIEFFNMGIDTVLTNDYLSIYNATKDILNKKRKLI